jgi:hypothetical protein
MNAEAPASTSPVATRCVLDAAVRLLSHNARTTPAVAELSLDPLWFVFAAEGSPAYHNNRLMIDGGPLRGSVVEPAGARGVASLRLFLESVDEPVASVALPPLLTCRELAELDMAALDEVLALYQGLSRTLSDPFDAVDVAISLVVESRETVR